VKAELRLTESEKSEVGKVISKLNKKGGWITASIIGDVIRISATKEEIEQVKAGIKYDDQKGRP
jgi:GTP-sensing pleiotropic transcriptional regulator CodY